jgi:putative DNA primase/helicase
MTGSGSRPDKGGAWSETCPTAYSEEAVLIMGTSFALSPEQQTIAELRHTLGVNGFMPVPVKTGDKMPLAKAWEAKAADGQFIDAFVGTDTLSTGILCSGLRAIDIDIDDADLAGHVVKYALAVFGQTTVRHRSNSGRALLLYRAVEGEPKKQRLFSKLFGHDKPQIQVEVLGKGNQFVAFGIHKSGVPYEWTYSPTTFRREQLPAVTEEQISEFLNKIRPNLWAENYLLDCVEKMAATQKGSRDDTQNQLAFSLGGLVPGGYLDAKKILTLLLPAVVKSGRLETNTEAELFAHFKRSVEQGYGKPWIPNCADAEAAEAAEDELLLASKFIEKHGAGLRYTDEWKKWMLWNGVTWQVDKTRKVFDLAKSIIRGYHIPKTSKNHVVAAIVTLANSDEQIATLAEHWDSDPNLTNMQGRVYDSLTDTIRNVNPCDYVTRTTSVAPDNHRPELWLRFLNYCTSENQEFIDYLQRMCGYVLTGSTKEDVLFFLYGPGKNGKSVFIDTISGIMGDYKTGVPMDALLASKNDRHPTELAKLMGARLAVAVETEAGRRWDESKVKTLTGSDEVTARFMRQDFFDFTPTHKFLIAGNNKPHLSGKVDEAWRRRFHIIPFTRIVEEKDRDFDLRVKLEAEWPNILQWMIEGCKQWRAQGLNPPQAVTAETNSYFEAEDTIGRWFADRCENATQEAFQPTAALFADFKMWAENTGEYAGKEKDFVQELIARGYCQDRRRVLGVQQRGFAGITFIPVMGNR